MQASTIDSPLSACHGINSTSHGNTSLTQRPHLTLEQKKEHVAKIEELKKDTMSHVS
jgi:mono/diheme cytochrome c family protein